MLSIPSVALARVSPTPLTHNISPSQVSEQPRAGHMLTAYTRIKIISFTVMTRCRHNNNNNIVLVLVQYL